MNESHAIAQPSALPGGETATPPSARRGRLATAAAATLGLLSAMGPEAWAADGPSIVKPGHIQRPGSVAHFSVGNIRSGGLLGISARSLKVIALTSDGFLARFVAGFPGLARSLELSGLSSPDSALVGIDFRVQDGNLYGVGDGGGLYTIDIGTGQATKIGALTVALEPSAAYGVDFNPAANALRILAGDTGQNLRHPFAGPLAGQTQADARLTYTTPPTAPATASGVTGAAYTNNDLDPNSATTLFDIDTNLDQVVIQSPPNNGILAAAGKLGVDAEALAGFDIHSRTINGATVENLALASLVVNGQHGLYQIDLLTGKATLLSALPWPVVDIALPLQK